MSNIFGIGSLFHKAAPETREEEESTIQVPVEKAAAELAAAELDELAAAELDARFREALASGEITGDIVAVDEQGREVKSRKRSNIFDA